MATFGRSGYLPCRAVVLLHLIDYRENNRDTCASRKDIVPSMVVEILSEHQLSSHTKHGRVSLSIVGYWWFANKTLFYVLIHSRKIFFFPAISLTIFWQKSQAPSKNSSVCTPKARKHPPNLPLGTNVAKSIERHTHPSLRRLSSCAVAAFVALHVSYTFAISSSSLVEFCSCAAANS